MDWTQILERDDLVGGDLETHEDGRVYRGPISEIKLVNGHVYFISPWTARLEDDGWKIWHINSCSVDAGSSAPSDIGDGRIHFVMPYLGFGVIYPKGGSQLDPNKVAGLVFTT